MAVQLRVAVVGSGPSGIFTAQLLGESDRVDAQVDVYDRLPVPYGLVRYGVAPDHPKIKSIVGAFAEVLADPRVRFLGNVTVGPDISITELRNYYDVVVFASGASQDRRLGIPGEHLSGVTSATEFVAWYSGHPDAGVDRFSLAGDTAVVVGAGNVALDVARLLNRSPDELRRTDMPEHVIEAIASSGIRDVRVLARRGPVHAKFTNKELIELGSLTDCAIVVDPADLELNAEDQEGAANPLVSRRMAILKGYADRGSQGGERTLRLEFNTKPTELHGDNGHVRSVRLARGTSEAISTTDVATQFVVRSIGYRGCEFEGLPFDERRGVIPHRAGRVIVDDEHLAGMYVTGWIKRGPSGVIGTNRLDANETVSAIIEDAPTLSNAKSEKSGLDPLELLRTREVAVVDWNGWLCIDRAEIELGRDLDRTRVKIHDRSEMLNAAILR
ncbi:FAD-dependent oxidoreductase [Rhodococcus koreensis]|uniref:FAD-dependent oxidoreductase n=1 Tax=Rhodococcus koreensis TaxID=99653 RepID=UPI00366B7260